MNRSHGLPTLAKCRRWPLLGLCAFFLASTGHAENLAAPPDDSLWLAASNKTLDKLRGGFDFGGGLMVSFGISRTVFINGQMVATTSFQVGDMAKLTSAQTEALGQQISTQAQVVQNGPGNRVDTGAGTVPLAIYIQNTLNNQTLRSQTVIDVASNGLNLVKSLNLQSTLNDSINNAIRSR